MSHAKLIANVIHQRNHKSSLPTTTHQKKRHSSKPSSSKSCQTNAMQSILPEEERSVVVSSSSEIDVLFGDLQMLSLSAKKRWKTLKADLHEQDADSDGHQMAQPKTNDTWAQITSIQRNHYRNLSYFSVSSLMGLTD